MHKLEREEMRHIGRKAWFLIALSSLAGCASTTQYVHLPDQTKLLEDPSKARIYVVRPTIFGSAIPMKIRDGDKFIGETGPKGYLCWERDPALVEITGKAENTARLPLTVEKGMVYYIQQRVRMGLLFARNKLSLLSEEKGKAALKKCKPPRSGNP